MKQIQAMWGAVFERNEARDPAELKAAREKADLREDVQPKLRHQGKEGKTRPQAGGQEEKGRWLLLPSHLSSSIFQAESGQVPGGAPAEIGG
jgi:hypothetical protein